MYTETRILSKCYPIKKENESESLYWGSSTQVKVQKCHYLCVQLLQSKSTGTYEKD